MNRMQKKAVTLSTAAALLLGAGVAQAQELTVTSWGGVLQDAQRKFYFEPYTAESGVKVIEDTWSGGFGTIEAMVTAGNPKWDVVQVEADEHALGCADGMFEKIDWAKIGDKEAFIPGTADDCGVGAVVWSVILAYDGNVLKDHEPKGWADFWDVKTFPGKRAMRRNPKNMLEFALMADGVPATEVYEVLAAPGGVDRAFAKLDELKPDLVWYDSGAQMLQLLVSGEVVMVAGFDGRVNNYNKTEGGNLKLVWPGSIYATDFWVVLKGAQHVSEAMDFLAVASRPENMAKLPTMAPFGLPQKAAADMVPDEYKAVLPTAPANLEGAIPVDVEFWLDNNEELTQRFNAWIGQ